ncbi:hypothetical protein [Xylanimonas ulmi]|uniref:Uncharacterized protein n=1 Tax=Xylanimonas ulmi TaxID=228973 RepID=A0A4Q7LZA3_9MICO|nr:hypothetical protein [Xylanibacterium ulmi]RZS60715.1 hypothetical protein EV386_0990 [Xylanibacterium ulmi]
MVNYIELTNLGPLARDTISELRRTGGQVPITRLGAPTGANLIVARPDAQLSLREATTDASRILAALDSTRPSDMTAMFYIHGYNELAIVLGDLLAAVGEPPDARRDDTPAV